MPRRPSPLTVARAHVAAIRASVDTMYAETDPATVGEAERAEAHARFSARQRSLWSAVVADGPVVDDLVLAIMRGDEAMVEAAEGVSA